MGEIERKFLLREDGQEFIDDSEYPLFGKFDNLQYVINSTILEGDNIKQGYLPLDKGYEFIGLLGIDGSIKFVPDVLRLRIINDRHFLFSLKGKGHTIRSEYNQEINDADLFSEFWPHTKDRRIYKYRLRIPFNGCFIEIDNFLDRDLIMYEVEFSNVREMANYEGVGMEVSENPQYHNVNMARPYNIILESIIQKTSLHS